MVFPTSPVWVYAATQGIHVTAGIAAIPLLAAKLWSVYPELLRWPPLKSVAHGLERASIALFVAASLVELAIGLLNTFQWYPWTFSFRDVHYWLAWVIIGSLAIHIAVKLPLIRAHWSRRAEARTVAEAAGEATACKQSVARAPRLQRGGKVLPGGAPRRCRCRAGTVDPRYVFGRRAFLTAVTVGTGAIVLTTAGQSFNWLAGLNVFAPRRMDTGPQGLPINRTAAQAGVAPAALAPDWTLTVAHGPNRKSFSLAQLAPCPSTATRCRSPASRGGARAPTGGACGSAT